MADKPMFWKVTLLDYERHLEASVNVQQMGGGDAIQLDSDYSDWVVKRPTQKNGDGEDLAEPELQFTTEILKVDKDAEVHARK
jgi:hypothetical protein